MLHLSGKVSKRVSERAAEGVIEATAATFSMFPRSKKKTKMRSLTFNGLEVHGMTIQKRDKRLLMIALMVAADSSSVEQNCREANKCKMQLLPEVSQSARRHISIYRNNRLPIQTIFY